MGVTRGGRFHGGAKERDSARVIRVGLKYLPWQKEVRRALIDGAGIIVLACGARSGKDRFGNQIGLELFYRKAAQRLEMEARGGERMIPRVNAWMVAPTEKLWQQNWDEFLAFIPPRLILERNKQAGLIRLRGDIAIKFKSADRPETLVSEGLDFLIVTEASRTRDNRVWYESLRPRLSSPGRDGVAILNGTPICGKGHWYRQLWDKAVETERKAIKAGDIRRSRMRQWNLPTWCNPQIPASAIADLKNEMTERTFKCEIAAEWPDEDEKPFRDSDIAKLVLKGNGEMPPVGSGFVKGLDIARKHDETFCVVGTERDGADRPAHVVDGFRLKNKRLPSQIRKCIEFEEKYPGMWVIDSTGTGGGYFVDQLRDAMPGVRIIEYPFTYDSKLDLVDGLKYAVETGGLALRSDLMAPGMCEELQRQLSVYECSVTDKNKLDYHGPGGREDDGVIALGLFWSRVAHKRVNKLDKTRFLVTLFG